MSTILKVFSAFSILISCLGLFGLAAYAAQVRTREIGIRKVIGASTTGLIRLLSLDFLIPVAVQFYVLHQAHPMRFHFCHVGSSRLYRTLHLALYGRIRKLLSHSAASASGKVSFANINKPFDTYTRFAACPRRSTSRAPKTRRKITAAVVCPSQGRCEYSCRY